VNLGTGRGYSVRDVIDAVRRITSRKFEVQEAERRRGDPPVLVAAVDRARSLLGWSATSSDLDNIISTAWRWHQSRR
jgi:UDP-glucose 4-epimerase